MMMMMLMMMMMTSFLVAYSEESLSNGILVIGVSKFVFFLNNIYV